MAKELKTNAMRLLDKNRIEYKMHLYECDGFLDGVSVANKLGQSLSVTFKTLIAQGKSKEYYVFVIPVAEELELKKAAKAVIEKSVELISVKDITKVSGYVRGGCSPIGMKKQFKTVLHNSALEQEKIIFSGGRLGTQIEMKPDQLINLIHANVADIIVK